MWIYVDDITNKVLASSESETAQCNVEVDSIPSDLFNESYGVSQYTYSVGNFTKIGCDFLTCAINDQFDDCDEKYMYYSFNDYNSHYGNLKTNLVNSSQTGYFDFIVPYDFNHVHELKLVGINQAIETAESITLTSTYALEGEAYDTNSETEDITINFATVDKIIELDLAVVFNNLTANHICGVSVAHNSITSGIHYIGIRMKYHADEDYS